MIRVEIASRVFPSAKRLGPQVVAEAERRLAALAMQFGNPHTYSGLGLRKLGPRPYELRLWRQWRLILLHEGDLLTAYDIT